MKTVAFKMPAKAADQWVGKGSEPRQSAPMKRFTLDVPVELHARIKSECARRGHKMADVLRELLEREFAKS